MHGGHIPYFIWIFKNTKYDDYKVVLQHPCKKLDQMLTRKHNFAVTDSF